MTVKYPNGGLMHQHVNTPDGDDGKEIFWPSMAEIASYSWLGGEHRKQMAHLVIHGEPVPAGRPRFTRQGHVFDPKRSREYKRFVSQEARLQYHGPILQDKALSVHVKVYRHVQSSVSKAERERRPIVKPDASNYLKLIEDALTGIVWEDDNLITDVSCSKYYSDDPRIEVTVTETGAKRPNNLKEPHY